MSASLNLSLTDELRRYVDERTRDNDVYATPSKYMRGLIRHDMQEHAVAKQVLHGLDDMKKGRFSSASIIDIKNETQE